MSSKTIPPVGGLNRAKEPGPRGRLAALAILDEILNKETSKTKIREALEEQLSLHPFWFFMNVVVPLLPKEKDIQLSVVEGTTRLTPDQVVSAMDLLTAGQANDDIPKDPSVDKRGRKLSQAFLDQQQKPKMEKSNSPAQVSRVKMPTRVRLP